MEKWIDAIGYEGLYMVSNMGNVKSIVRKNHKILKCGISNTGYRIAILRKDNSPKTHKVSRLVYQSFYGKTNLVIDHIVEGNKTDDRLCNLQAITQRENASKYNRSVNRSSVYTGVTRNNLRNKWQSNIRINGVLKHLGLFESEFEAHLAYKQALPSQ